MIPRVRLSSRLTLSLTNPESISDRKWLMRMVTLSRPQNGKNIANQRLHANAAIALLFHIGHHWRGVGEPYRSIWAHVCWCLTPRGGCRNVQA